MSNTVRDCTFITGAECYCKPWPHGRQGNTYNVTVLRINSQFHFLKSQKTFESSETEYSLTKCLKVAVMWNNLTARKTKQNKTISIIWDQMYQTVLQLTFSHVSWKIFFGSCVSNCWDGNALFPWRPYVPFILSKCQRGWGSDRPVRTDLDNISWKTYAQCPKIIWEQRKNKDLKLLLIQQHKPSGGNSTLVQLLPFLIGS